MATALGELSWPKSDFTLAPMEVYVDPDIFEREQTRIFRDPTWQILGTESDVADTDHFNSEASVRALERIL